MTKATYQKIIKKTQTRIKRLAAKNGWLWFYNLHQKEMVACAERLLKVYRRADYKIVIISCWLHDIAQYYARSPKEILAVKANHHITGAEIAVELLRGQNISRKETEKIKRCILCHRNQKPFIPETIEEKIVTVADTMSHFSSIFYLIYFKFHPTHSLEQMVFDDLNKLKRDYRDLKLLPQAPRLVAEKYRVIKRLLSNYNKA